MVIKVFIFDISLNHFNFCKNAIFHNKTRGCLETCSSRFCQLPLWTSVSSSVKGEAEHDDLWGPFQPYYPGLMIHLIPPALLWGGEDSQHYIYKEETMERGSMTSWLDFETRRTWIWVSSLYFLFKRPWTDYSSSLGPGFLSYKMDIR